MNNISRPIYHIKRYGWNNFVKREIINLSTDVQVSQFMPNIGLHLIGNGMQYVKLYEWYDYKNYPYPKLLSFITTTSYQLINEIVENGSFQGTNVDPISDLLIFNPLGILLFSTNFSKKFFSEKIKLLDWSLMPFYNPVQHSIENAGQQYAAKLSLSRETKYSLFLYWGVISTIGLSCNLNSTDAITFSAGGIVYKLRENKARSVRYMTPELDYVLGIFYDRNNSLMSSIIFTGPKFYNIRIDTYPGFIKLTETIRPGFFIGVGKMDKLQIGVICRFSPLGVIGQFIN